MPPPPAEYASAQLDEQSAGPGLAGVNAKHCAQTDMPDEALPALRTAAIGLHSTSSSPANTG
eukprot:scaffold7293_cov126-Isochrysis_galbana.AAC.2